MDNLEAIKLVKDLLYRRMDMMNYFYSGDKDTFCQAYDEIMEQKGHKGFYDADVEERKINSEKYKIEIDEQFERSISYRKELDIFYNKVDELLNEFNEQETHNAWFQSLSKEEKDEYIKNQKD